MMGGLIIGQEETILQIGMFINLFQSMKNDLKDLGIFLLVALPWI